MIVVKNIQGWPYQVEIPDDPDSATDDTDYTAAAQYFGRLLSSRRSPFSSDPNGYGDGYDADYPEN